jgi:hypothetical protein
MDLIAEEAIPAVNEISVFITTHGNVSVNSNKSKKGKTQSQYQVLTSNFNDLVPPNSNPVCYEQIMAEIGYVATHIPQTVDLYKKFCYNRIRPILLQLLTNENEETINLVKFQISQEFKTFLKDYVDLILPDFSRLLATGHKDHIFSRTQELLTDTLKISDSELEPSDIPGLINSIKTTSGILTTLVNVLSLLLFNPKNMISGYLITKSQPIFPPKRLSTELNLLNEEKSWDISINLGSISPEFGWFGDSDTTNRLFRTSIDGRQEKYEITTPDLIKTILLAYPKTKLLEIYDSSCAIVETDNKKRTEITDSKDIQGIISQGNATIPANKITMSDEDAIEISNFVKELLRSHEYEYIVKLLLESFTAVQNLSSLPKTISSYKPQMKTGFKSWLTNSNIAELTHYKNSLLHPEALINFLKEEQKRKFQPISASLPTETFDFESVVEPVENPVKMKRGLTFNPTLNTSDVSKLTLRNDATLAMALKKNKEHGGSKHKRSRKRRRNRGKKTKKRGKRRTKKRYRK